MNSSKKETLGFVGLGIMGFAMAQNAQKAGYKTVVTNRSREKRENAQRAGMNVVESPTEVAQLSDAIVVMVSDPKAVHEVTQGSHGILSGNVKGKTLIQMSTIDQATTLSLAKEAKTKEMEFLDCPVAGSKKQVEEAQLIVLAGGQQSTLNKWNDFFLSIGKAVVYAGDIGKGTALKLCINLIVAQMTTALCESVALAEAEELNPHKIFEVLSHSPALNCGYFKIKENNLIDKSFSPAFSLQNMLKDVRFMNEAAKSKGLQLPITQAVEVMMQQAEQLGFGSEDLTSVAKVLN